MNVRISVGGRILCLATIATICGCAPIRVAVPVDFEGDGLSFDVVAGQPTSKSGPVSGFDSPVEIGGGAIGFNASDFTIVADDFDDQKQAALLQAGGALEITVHLGPADSQATVCETGDTYGPFEVTLDENNVPQSVSPSTVILEQSSIDLLNAGVFSYCLEIVSPVSGEVIVGAMQFNVGP